MVGANSIDYYAVVIAEAGDSALPPYHKTIQPTITYHHWFLEKYHKITDGIFYRKNSIENSIWFSSKKTWYHHVLSIFVSIIVIPPWYLQMILNLLVSIYRRPICRKINLFLGNFQTNVNVSGKRQWKNPSRYVYRVDRVSSYLPCDHANNKDKKKMTNISPTMTMTMSHRPKTLLAMATIGWIS